MVQKIYPIFLEVYGEPGVGKTHLACTFPKPFMGLSVDDRYAWVQNYEEFKSAVLRAIAREDVKTVVIDSCTPLQDFAAEYWCKKYGKERVYPVVAWGQVRKLIDEVINLIAKYRKNCVFTSQMKDVYDKETGQKIGRDRDGYIKVPFTVDIQVELRILPRDQAQRYVKEIKSQGKYVRVAKIHKNRLLDITEPYFAEFVESPTWEDIKRSIAVLPPDLAYVE